jgi:uncharacterized protein (DUF433 family)
MTDAIVQAITYIVKTPGFRDGEPHFAGRHLSVEGIVYSYVHLGASVDDLVRAYDLTPAQVHAALAYYYDHTDELQAIWDENKRIEDAHVPSPEERARTDQLLAKLKERNPEAYERIMHTRNERDE